MTDQNDPLNDLIQADAGAIDRSLLKDVLKSFVVFNSDGEVTLLKDFYALGNQQKILVVLVAQKAKSLLFEGVDEGLSPSTLIGLQIMAEGSVKSTLKQLLEKTYEVKKNASGQYYVPTYLLPEMKTRLEGAS